MIRPSIRRYLATRWDRRRALSVAMLAAIALLVIALGGWRDPLVVLVVIVAIMTPILIIGALAVGIFLLRARLIVGQSTVTLVGIARTSHFPRSVLSRMERATVMGSLQTRLRYLVAVDAQRTVLFTLFDGLWDLQAVEEVLGRGGVPVVGDWSNAVHRRSLRIGSELP